MKERVTLIDFEFYYKIFNTVANPIFIKDRNFRHILVNDAFCYQIGICRDDIIGKTDDAFFPKKECKGFREKDMKILDTGITDENEEFLTLPDGTRHRLITRKSLLQTSDGDKFILGIINDISDKVNLLNKLRESQKKYKSIFNLIPDPVAIFTYPGRIAIDVNDSFLRMSKVTRRSVIGRQGTHAFRWVDAKERDDYFRLLEKNRKVDNHKISLGLSDSTVVPFLVSARMIKLEQETSVLYTLRDISGIVRTQEALRQSENLYKTIFNSTQ
jgi:PAS domain S-box-containing protein